MFWVSEFLLPLKITKVWLGGSDKNGDGAWEWETSPKPFDYK